VWGENYVRVSITDFLKYIDAQEVIVARLDDVIVGGIRVFKLEEGVWSFSLLGAALSASGKGVGRSLIQAAEGLAISKGAQSMRIEVLRADNISVESKVILHNWYERLGYAFVKSVDVFEVYDDAEKWSKLVNPSIFDCYQKSF
jgi:GNAT superfamily N-acetyltransferase